MWAVALDGKVFYQVGLIIVGGFVADSLQNPWDIF
jgi:hypothetical protein